MDISIVSLFSLQMTEMVVMMEMNQLEPENLAGPTLGLLISLYAITTGSTFFLLQSTCRSHSWMSSRNVFRAINILYGGSMFLSMLVVSSQLVTRPGLKSVSQYSVEHYSNTKTK